MAKEKFTSQRFRATSLLVVDRANEIITDFQRQGYRLTLRQLYYQFIARDVFPDDWIDEAYNQKNGLQPNTKNTEKNYKRLGDLISNARKAGLVDWSAIEDRTRFLRQVSMWDSPDQILSATAYQYKQNPWDTQPYSPEVWVEKDALLGVISKVADRHRVPYLACKGYASQSEVYDAGKRFAYARSQGQRPIVFHLGDHDPSGIDMTRDNGARLSLFARYDVEFVRLALSIEQVQEYNPPPNPAKETDSRFVDYRDRFGDECWELDALEPKVMSDIVETAINGIRDEAAWAETLKEEESNMGLLKSVSDNWTEVVEWMKQEGMASD